jgi:hypothetical protein
MSALERQMLELAGKQATHEEVCGVRYKALEEKATAAAVSGIQNSATLAEIKETLSAMSGGRRMLIGLATVVGVPLVGLIGALLSGRWVMPPHGQ